MFERSAGGVAVVLENQRVAKAPVVLEIEHAVAVGAQHVLDGAV